MSTISTIVEIVDRVGNPMKIKKPKLSELSRIICITKQAYKIPYKKGGVITKPHKETAGFRTEFQNKKFGILTACEKEKIVGAIRYFKPEKNTLCFYKLAVLKKFRNKGIAEKLVKKVEKIAKKQGLRKVVLNCMEEKELPNYYRKLGYKTGKTVKYHNHREVKMFKNI